MTDREGARDGSVVIGPFIGFAHPKTGVCLDAPHHSDPITEVVVEHSWMTAREYPPLWQAPRLWLNLFRQAYHLGRWVTEERKKNGVTHEDTIGIRYRELLEPQEEAEPHFSTKETGDEGDGP